MKRIFTVLSLITLAAHAENAPAPAAPPELTPEQKANVLKQLDDLERTIMQQRGTNLSSIIAKLHTAASSDAACINFLEDCDKLVNVDRKDGTRDDKRRIEEKAQQAKRGETKKQEEKDGDHNAGLRLTLEFLALSLEASDAKDIASMIPKVQAYHQSLISHGDKLKGRTGEMLMQPVARGRRGGGLDVGLVVEAYQLERYLKREDWSREPGNIMDMYDRLMLKVAREKKKEDLATTWDTAISTETAFRKVRMAEGDYKVWLEQEYPVLRWQRAKDLVQTGPNAITGMAEMLKVIKEFPSHPSSPAWVRDLREMVAPPKQDTAEPAQQ